MKVDTDGLANAVDEIRRELVPYEDRIDHRKGTLYTAAECLRQIGGLEAELEELRKRDKERKGVIDDALTDKCERLRVAHEQACARAAEFELEWAKEKSTRVKAERERDEARAENELLRPATWPEGGIVPAKALAEAEARHRTTEAEFAEYRNAVGQVERDNVTLRAEVEWLRAELIDRATACTHVDWWCEACEDCPAWHPAECRQCPVCCGCAS